MTSPVSIEARGLRRREAAALVGLSPTAFDRARKGGLYPSPTLPGSRYDRKLLESAMDKLSGLREGNEGLSALDVWRGGRGSH